MRGNPQWDTRFHHRQRSIPARAGKPPSRASTPGPGPVYPRACGETTTAARGGAAVLGLSPRVRGNPSGCISVFFSARSIPARAGKPNPSSVPSSASPVYPRACGETSWRSRVFRRRWGLSPRVRGNPESDLYALARPGSIPARAGKPSKRNPFRETNTVYPRACGETALAIPDVRAGDGLSPRVRGNPSDIAIRHCLPGSIPARAGKPYSVPTFPNCSKVYPRACGETGGRDTVSQLVSGLSPRVRGNLVAVCQPDQVLGSIPARAGKPIHAHPGSRRGQVYPRACGETPGLLTEGVTITGLSPRVRGNRVPGGRGGGGLGSIPARAGKPPR